MGRPAGAGGAVLEAKQSSSLADENKRVSAKVPLMPQPLLNFYEVPLPADEPFEDPVLLNKKLSRNETAVAKDTRTNFVFGHMLRD